MEEHNEYLAGLVHAAIAGLGTNEDLLIEVICTKTDDELKNIALAFKKRYGKDMVTEILDDLSGDMKMMFKSIFEVIHQKYNLIFSTNDLTLLTKRLPKKMPRFSSIREKANGEPTKKSSLMSSLFDPEVTWLKFLELMQI